MNRIFLSGVAAISLAVSAQTSPTDLPDLDIRADGTALPRKRAGAASMPETADSSLASALSRLPGLQLRARGAHGAEPVIRGLGWERVATRYNGMPLYGACPSRMDPPVNLFHPDGLSEIAVEVGPPSVTLGPLKSGGSLEISDPLTLTEIPVRQADVSGGVQTDGSAVRGAATYEARRSRHAARVEAGASSRGDRTAGDGTEIPAHRESIEIGGQVALRTGEAAVLQGGLRHVEERDIDFPALPMDSREAETLLGTVLWSWKPQHAAFSQLDLKAGGLTTDHLMDNRDKPNRGRLEASTPSTSDSRFVSMGVRFPGAGGEWRLGMDGSSLERDATRTRRLVSSGMTFRDPIWPGLEQDALGVFTEWEGPLGDHLTLRAGARVDHWETDAARADESIVPGPGYGRTTVENAYREVGGLRGDVDQQDWLKGGNLRVRYQPADAWAVMLGLGYTEAAPNLTQRYQAFGPIPGGFGIGSPDLSPETKRELEVRVEHTGGRHRTGLAVHASRIDDYLLPVTVARIDVNGDGRIDRVRGTRNRDASLWGLEAESIWRLTDQIRLPLSVEWVRGEVRGSGEPLPEIAPLEARAALEWRGTQAWRPTGSLETRYAHQQTRVNTGFGEDRTPSFALVHVRGSITPREGLVLEAGIENLLDRTYHEHLTREAALPVGDLAAGDEIPGAGRRFYVNLRVTW